MESFHDKARMKQLNQRSTWNRRLVSSLLLLCCGSFLLLTGYNEWDSLETIQDSMSSSGFLVLGNRHRQLEKNDENESRRRPVMHTFYEFAENETGMSKEGDIELLKLWETYWNEAGWDTRILTMDDIPKTERNQERIDIVNSMKKIGKYNRYCFLRWLAMAKVGGWMSDYDVFPLYARNNVHLYRDGGDEEHNYLPNDGRFTGYDRIKGQLSSVPSLLSGSPAEWERLVENAIVNLDVMKLKQNEFWNDQRALMKYGRETKDGFILRKWVIPAQQLSHTFHSILTLEQQEEAEDSTSDKQQQQQKVLINCDQIKGKMAIHLSHRAVHDIYQYHHKQVSSSNEKDPSISFKNQVENRSMLIQNFLRAWKEQCDNDDDNDETG